MLERRDYGETQVIFLRYRGDNGALDRPKRLAYEFRTSIGKR